MLGKRQRLEATYSEARMHPLQENKAKAKAAKVGEGGAAIAPVRENYVRLQVCARVFCM